MTHNVNNRSDPHLLQLSAIASTNGESTWCALNGGNGAGGGVPGERGGGGHPVEQGLCLAFHCALLHLPEKRNQLYI